MRARRRFSINGLLVRLTVDDSCGAGEGEEGLNELP